MSSLHFMQRNSLLHWFPAVQSLGIPHPPTVIVPSCPSEMMTPLKLQHALIEAGRQLGGYPLFLRTDQTAGKHRWIDTCYVPNEAALIPHAVAVVEENCLADLDPEAFVLRRLLPVSAPFSAFHGMPVTKEMRLFAEAGAFICAHWYWPEAALAEGRHKPALPDDWRERLAELQSGDTPSKLQQWAEAVTGQLGEAWSVDVLCDADGQWWLTDMALAGMSYHAPECEHQFPDPRLQTP